MTVRDLLPLMSTFRASDKDIARAIRDDEPLEFLRGDAVVRVSFEVEPREEGDA